MDRANQPKVWRATDVDPAPGPIGREAELDAIESFVRDRATRPNGLIIEGPAGAGKTTLWRAAVDLASAQGDLVLAARAAGAEVNLSLSVLTDLLEAHLQTVLPEVPAPQRRALEVALLVADDSGRGPDPRALFAGALTVVRALARQRPLVLAVDDAQWVDPESAEILEFVVRRLADLPVAVITTWRTPSPPAPAAPSARALRIERALDRAPIRLSVGPMSPGALHSLLRTRTSLDVNRRSLRQIHETSGGNPFYALELARAAERDAELRTSPGEPPPLGAGLGELLTDRLAGLDEPTRDALFVAAAASQPTIGLIDSVVAVDARAALGPAIEVSIIRLDGDAIEFTHPLLAAAAYAAPDTDRRRRYHAKLSNAVSDPEARGRHLALARRGPDLEVAQALHDAAQSARMRGATATAGELLVEAIGRLPDDEVERRAEWAVPASVILQAAGDLEGARSIVARSLGEVAAGPIRADLLLELADIVESDPGGGERTLELIEEAFREAGDDPRRQAAALLDREQVERSRDRLADAFAIAKEAVALAEVTGDEPLLAAAHVRTADLDVVLGYDGDPIERFGRALDLASRAPVEAQHSAMTMLACGLIRRGRLDDARPWLVDERRRTIAEGDESSRQMVLVWLTELEWLAGRWDDAATHAREGLELSQLAGARMRQGLNMAMLGLVEGSRGDLDRGRRLAADGRAILDEVGETAYGNYAGQVLGFLELSAGNIAAAIDHLVGAYEVEHGVEGSKRITFIGDEIEALVAAGRLGDADALAQEVGRRGRVLRRPLLDAVAARGRAIVLGAQGRLDEAIAAAQEAVEGHAALNMPFDRARSLLVLGEVQRRAKQRRAARETLTAAMAAFDELGASVWSERAAAERARVGGRTAVEGLTETELRVARLVAEGRSNKEIAAELYVTVRAVESNLSKVYAKLGIRSRTELSRRL
ncbi:MAG TPA: AAA family ATPase [Candidatus Limnocylindrales bacterium]|nr:AAA family ATPase [Candidatus Limnocylindrales bacterium]